MNKSIDLLALLEYVEDYILIKIWEDFPKYISGTDIDLVVLDRQYAIRAISQYYADQLNQTWEMQVTDRKNYCHIDLFINGEFDLRIDLIDGFDFFRNIAVKPAFFTKLFMLRQKKVFDGYSIFVPSEVDELTLRYFEYLEWFDRRPDKIKHLEYICDVNDEILKKHFFENTHQFIQFKRKTWPEGQPVGINGQYSPITIHSRKYAIRQILRSAKYIVKTTIRQLMKSLKIK